MLPSPMNTPKRVLMTLDAVGGLWRYSVDLARCLAAEGIECVLVGFGPAPGKAQQRECRDLRNVALRWTRLPLDWMVDEEAALDEVGDTLVAIGREWDVDLLHLNLPSQAAMIADGLPVVVTSHSCIATWWQAVRGYATATNVAMAANVDRARSHACGRGHGTDQQPWRRIDRVLWADGQIACRRERNGNGASAECRRTDRLCRRTLVGRRQECKHARRRRRPVALAGGHGGCAQWPEWPERAPATCAVTW